MQLLEFFVNLRKDCFVLLYHERALVGLSVNAVVDAFRVGQLQAQLPRVVRKFSCNAGIVHLLGA